MFEDKGLSFYVFTSSSPIIFESRVLEWELRAYLCEFSVQPHKFTLKQILFATTLRYISNTWHTANNASYLVAMINTT